MRVSEDVTYCKKDRVCMFSDASDFQLAGAQIEDGEVDWNTRFRCALAEEEKKASSMFRDCLLYTSPSPRDGLLSRMPSSA